MIVGELVLAYDLGTSGVKGVLVSTDGEVAASATAGYPYRIPQPGWAEQEPEDYWNGVCSVTHQVLEESGIPPSQIAGIAFGTLWKGVIPVDSDGNVLRSSILWLDSRAGKEAKCLNAHFGTTRFEPTDYWSKLLWLNRNEPETVSKAKWILEVNSYLKLRATGNTAVDISNCFTRSFDPELDAFDADVLAYIGISRDKFPECVPATRKTGVLTETAASQMGLVPGIPVFAGNTDIQGVTVGAGTAGIGGVHGYFGSSGWLGFTVPHHKSLRGASFDEHRDVVLSGMKSVGLALTWVAKNVYSHEYEQLGEGVYELISRDAAQIPPGAGGVLATGWIHGENPPQADLTMGASFLNLKSCHDRRHIARAVMEGICLHLKQRTVDSCRWKGLPYPERIHAVGGGACSDVWMQILADVLNVTVAVPASPRHAGAVGTAYCALIGLGLCPDYETAGKRLKIQRTFTPEPKAAGTYEQVYDAYTQLYTTLKPIVHIMNEVRENHE